MAIRRLLGQILVEMGFVTSQQLDEALQRQKRLINNKTLQERIQWVRLVSEARLSVDTDKIPTLGQILTDMEFITKEQLEEALKEQEKSFEIYRSLENEKLGVAIEIGSLVNSTLDFSEVLHLTMKHVNRVTNSVASTLMLLHEKTGELVFCVPTGPKADNLVDVRLPPGEGIAGWVAKHEQPILVPDAREDTRFYSNIDKISGLETKSILCVPLKSKTKLIGVLEVVNKVDGTCFTKEDELLLCIFGYQAAVALENARLHGELKDRLEEHKYTKDALQESEEKYRTVLEANPDPVVVYDMEGKVVYFNPAFTSVFGWTLEERLGKKMDVFVPEEAWPKTKAMIDMVLAGESFSGIETRRYTKEGSIIPVSLSGAIYRDRDGNPVGSVINIRDISEQKKIEAQLIQSQRMEAVYTLAGGIAHDFNNLLSGIHGRASLMMMDIDSSHPHFEHLDGIGEYVKSSVQLTKQLLGFARSGKYEVKSVDINEIVERSSKMFSRTKKEIRVHRENQENIWVVEVDPGQIEQLLLNLYVNAWHAMPGGGDLYINTENVIIDENYIKPYQIEIGKYVKISVTDTGIGMDKSTQQRIFEPFFTTKEIGRGTGLGLASVYGIIKNHGGFINVYSEKGVGTTFNFYLPASKDQVLEQEKVLSKTVLKGSETILLVDDEDMIIDVERDVLKLLGYNVLVAKGGKEAIQAYKKKQDKIDMVILDMIMPGMNGGEVYDKLKEINPGIKVLLSSGYSLNGQAAEILEQGCNDFIQKPFNMMDISEKIREILDKE